MYSPKINICQLKLFYDAIQIPTLKEKYISAPSNGASLNYRVTANPISRNICFAIDY